MIDLDDLSSADMRPAGARWEGDRQAQKPRPKPHTASAAFGVMARCDEALLACHRAQAAAESEPDLQPVASEVKAALLQARARIQEAVEWLELSE